MAVSATFDRRDPGTPEERWRSSGIFERASPLDLAGVRRVVVLSAHPDDEALGAAGLIRRMHSLGAQVDVLVATDGEASHPGSPTHSPERIAALRRSEMCRALGHLAPRARLRPLGLGGSWRIVAPARTVPSRATVRRYFRQQTRSMLSQRGRGRQAGTGSAAGTPKRRLCRAR